MNNTIFIIKLRNFNSIESSLCYNIVQKEIMKEEHKKKNKWKIFDPSKFKDLPKSRHVHNLLLRHLDNQINIEIILVCVSILNICLVITIVSRLVSILVIILEEIKSRLLFQRIEVVIIVNFSHFSIVEKTYWVGLVQIQKPVEVYLINSKRNWGERVGGYHCKTFHLHF